MKKVIGIIVIAIILVLVFSLGNKSNLENLEPIKVGAVLPITGAASFVGEEIQNGVNLALQEVNKDTEVIKLFTEDSQSSPTAGVSAANKLINIDGADVLVSALSSVSMSVAPVAEENMIPMLGIVVTAPNFTEEKDWIYRYYPTAEDEVAVVTDYVEKEGLENIGLIYLNDDFGLGVKNVLEELSSNNGVNVYSESYVISENDFRSQLTKILSNNIELLYVVGFDSHMTNIIKRSQELGYEGLISGPSTLSLPKFWDGSSITIEDSLFGAPLIYQEDGNSDLIKFRDSYNKTYGRYPSHYAANGYDSIKLLVSALEKEGEGNVKKALDGLRSFSGIFGKLKFKEDGHEISFPLVQAKIQGNELIYKN